MSNVRVTTTVVTEAKYESRTSCYMIKNKKKGTNMALDINGACPDCEGTNLNEDKTRCWDCDPEF